MSSDNIDNVEQPADDDQLAGDLPAADQPAGKSPASKSGSEETFQIEKPAKSKLNFGQAMYLQKGLKILASLKLTVTLFALSLILVLAGTVAQAIPGNDIWVVVSRYFRCWFTWLDVYSFHPLFRGIIDLSGVSPQKLALVLTADDDRGGEERDSRSAFDGKRRLSCRLRPTLVDAVPLRGVSGLFSRCRIFL